MDWKGGWVSTQGVQAEATWVVWTQVLMDHWGILSMVDILRGVVKRSGRSVVGEGQGRNQGKKPKNIVSVFEMTNSKLDSEIMLLQEKRKIGR